MLNTFIFSVSLDLTCVLEIRTLSEDRLRERLIDRISCANLHKPLYFQREDKLQHPEFFSRTTSTISHYFSSHNNWNPLQIEVLTTRQSWKLCLIHLGDAENVHEGKKTSCFFMLSLQHIQTLAFARRREPQSCHLHCRRNQSIFGPHV